MDGGVGSDITDSACGDGRCLRCELDTTATGHSHSRFECWQREHEGFWVQTAYRYPKRRVAPGAPVDPKEMAPLTGLVVKSILTGPAEGATIAASGARVEGFAWAGEVDVERVDVSTDGGCKWQPARLGGYLWRWAWRRF